MCPTLTNDAGPRRCFSAQPMSMVFLVTLYVLMLHLVCVDVIEGDIDVVVVVGIVVIVVVIVYFTDIVVV